MGCGAVQNLQASQPTQKSDVYKELKNSGELSKNNPNQKSIETKASNSSSQKQTMNRNYQIKQLLGRGTYGEVYRCIQKQTGEEFALKRVKLNAKNKDEAKRHVLNLKSEISVLKKLNHPNIVKYYNFDISPDDETVEIIFQLVKDGSLKDYLQKNGPLSEPQASRFCQQILEGLDYLHQKSIIHRDLKCANILITENGIIKITDFGTAKQIKVKSHQDIAKLCASLKGTPFYMAPQILKRSGHHKSADIWSFGCTLIEMLTGKPPWITLTENFQQIISYIVSGIHPPLPRNISKECDFFLQSCFDIIPSQRLTARQLLKHRFILMNSKATSPSIIYEKFSPKNEEKSITPRAGTRNQMEELQIIDLNSVEITKRKGSARKNTSLQSSEINYKNHFNKSSQIQISIPIKKSAYLDTPKNNQLAKPIQNQHCSTIQNQYSSINRDQVQVSEPYVPAKKKIKNSRKNKMSELKRVTKTDGHVKMTEQNLIDWKEIEEQMFSNSKNSAKDFSSKLNSSIGNTYAFHNNQYRATTENTEENEMAINTNLAKQEREWYLENQRRQRQRKEDEKRKWEEELRKQSEAITAKKKYISEIFLRNFQ